MENDQKFEIVLFEKLTNCQNLTIRKIEKNLQFEKLLNILDVQIISKKWKKNRFTFVVPNFDRNPFFNFDIWESK